MPFAKQLRLKGHLLDAGIISEVFDVALERGGSCRILAWELGATKWTPSHATIILSAKSALELEILSERVALIPCDGPLEEEDASHVPPVQVCQWVMFRLFHLTALESSG